MQRSASKWLSLTVFVLSLAACADEGVGDPCIPEAIPYDPSKLNVAQANVTGGYGFASSETYIESSSVQCRSRLCIVRKLDNGTGDKVPADPRGFTCADHPGQFGCVSPDALAKSVYCTCKCAGPKTRELCDCPSGFTCKEVDGLSLAGEGIRGSYCVRPEQ